MKILHLEDNPTDAELAQALLQAEWPACEIAVRATRSDFLASLTTGRFDVILSDFNLPGFNGLEALGLAREITPDTPFVFLSGTIGEERALEAVRNGAADYVLKDRMMRLPVALRRAVEEATELRRRRQAEAALRQSEANLREAQALAGLGSAEFDPTTGRWIWSDSLYRLLDLNPARCIPSREELVALLHPDSREAFLLLSDPAMPVRGRAELRYQLRSGATLWVEMRNEPRFDDTGRLVTLRVTALDITEHKEAANALRDSLELFRTAMEAAPIGKALVAPAGRFLRVNPALCELVGYSEAELLGRDFQSITHPDDLAADLEFVRRLLAREITSYEMEKRYLHKDGRAVWALLAVALVWNRDGSPRYFVSQIQDITVRRQAELRLREQAEILDRAPVAVMMTGLDQHVIYWNKGAERIFGRKVNEALGLSLDDLLPPAVVARLHTEAGSQREEWRGEVLCTVLDGRRLILELVMSHIRDDAGQPQARLLLGTDITEKKALEEKFLRAQRLENLGLLAAGIAHDLNNVLAPVLMVPQLLRRRLSSPSDLKLLETLEDSAARGTGLVKQILSFAKGTGGERQLVQLKHLAREIVAFINHTFPRTIVCRHTIPADLWPVHANPTQLHQVILNLCVNARDAMPAGGTLRLQLANLRLDPTALPDARPGNFVHLEISDTGTGIPSEILPRIWEPFFTTKQDEKGTGLGLSTVRGIVTNHEGYCHATNRPEGGAVFHIYLPADAAESESAEPAT